MATLLWLITWASKKVIYAEPSVLLFLGQLGNHISKTASLSRIRWVSHWPNIHVLLHQLVVIIDTSPLWDIITGLPFKFIILFKFVHKRTFWSVDLQGCDFFADWINHTMDYWKINMYSNTSQGQKSKFYKNKVGQLWKKINKFITFCFKKLWFQKKKWYFFKNKMFHLASMSMTFFLKEQLYFHETLFLKRQDLLYVKLW